MTADRLDAYGRDAMKDRTPGLLSAVVPEAVVWRLLEAQLEVPSAFIVGHRTPFYFHVKNRLPTSVRLSLPTSRTWGWTVDGQPEAGRGGYEPPRTPTELVFASRERRTFTGYWAGRFCERSVGSERWPPALGERELTAYIAVDQWADRGVCDRTMVDVVDQTR